MADNIALYTGTGRRKEATARVRLIPGTGKVRSEEHTSELQSR